MYEHTVNNFEAAVLWKGLKNNSYFKTNTKKWNKGTKS